MRKGIGIGALCLIAFSSAAQPEIREDAPTVVPATPNATKMTDYFAQRPNMYTGTANVSIPLYTINFEGWKLPMSVSYNATGIRPNEEASEVGLGWALQATGVISRSINGFDDLFPGYNSGVHQGYVYNSRNHSFSTLASYFYTSTAPPSITIFWPVPNCCFIK